MQEKTHQPLSLCVGVRSYCERDEFCSDRGDYSKQQRVAYTCISEEAESSQGFLVYNSGNTGLYFWFLQQNRQND